MMLRIDGGLINTLKQKEIRMNREFNPPLTETEQLEIANQYVLGSLVKAAVSNKDLEYAPPWVKQLSETGDLIVLNTDCCDCMGDGHRLTVGVEYEEEFDHPAITFWTDLSCYHSTFEAWSRAFDRRKTKLGRLPNSRWDSFVLWFTKMPGVVGILYGRFKTACKLFFTGYCKWEGGTTFKDKKHVADLMLALWWAQNRCQENYELDKERREDFRIRNKARIAFNLARDIEMSKELVEQGFEASDIPVAPV